MLALDRAPEVVWHAPFTHGRRSRTGTAATYDPAARKHPFDPVRPAAARALASMTGLTAFQQPEQKEPRKAASPLDATGPHARALRAAKQL
ncbi:hypothetical protein ABZW30_45820 [Kitasatospora sp. NPDC004669]|uniref:hypothetical protein n=1 Tax=Kitasatospora sp. NPDC004669 TaxID=3154555 RepID=UPI0033AD3CB7